MKILIKSNGAIKYSDLENKLSIENLKMEDVSGEELINEIDENYTYFYIPGKSSTGVLLSLEKSGYYLHINDFSSHQDFELAKQLVIALAELNKSSIQFEGAMSKITVEDFKDRFFKIMVYKIIQDSLDTLEDKITDKKEVLQVGYGHHTFYIGPKVYGDLKKRCGGLHQNIYNEIIERLIKIKYPEYAGIQPPTILSLEDKYTQVMYKGAKCQILYKVDEIIFVDLADSGFHSKFYSTSFEYLQPYAEQQFIKLDEEQYIIPKLEEKQFYQMLKKVSATENKKAAGLLLEM